MSEDLLDVEGGCFCGSVRFRATGVRPQVTECHCAQCRKQAGHRYASARVATSAIRIEGADNITWFRASPAAERGFCRSCGSHLFWKSSNRDHTSLLAASIDQPNGLRMAKHIYVEDKGDYYEITDDLPRFAGYDTPVPPEET